MNFIIPKKIKEAPLLYKPSLHYDIGSSLVLAPHPDDESLGCGGMIALLRQKNVNIQVVFVTDGAASHPNSEAYPPAKIAALRQKEALNACKALNISEERVVFLNQPDGRLDVINSKKAEEIVQILVNIVKDQAIKTVFVPYRKDAHSDHRATWLLASKMIDRLKDKPALVEYPIWLWKNGASQDYPASKDFNFFRLDVAEVLDKKKAAIAAHQSQVSDLINDDPTGFKLTDELLSPFLKPVEYYFFDKRKNLETLNQSYFDGLYTNKRDPWNFERSSYEHEKYERSLKVLRNHYDAALEVGCSIGVFTKKLAAICKNLLAVDISELPLSEARERCAGLDQVSFKAVDVTQSFPSGHYDLITIAEVGYYLSVEELERLFKNCDKYLVAKGHLLLVHWTSYVEEYPLTGHEVHQQFENYSRREGRFTQKTIEVHDAYELVLWVKN